MSSVSVFRGVDFTGTDWADRNADIAERLGVDPSLVAAARRHFGMETSTRPDWSMVDFDRPRAEIAAELGVSVASVGNAKRAMGMQRERIAWREVDWSKTDAEIAEECGCAVSSVWRARKTHGAGQGAPAKRGRPVKYPAGGVELVAGNADMVSGSLSDGSEEQGGVRARTAAEWAKDRSKRTISVLFSQADFDALTEASTRTGVTKTDIIREAVAAWIVIHK